MEGAGLSQSALCVPHHRHCSKLEVGRRLQVEHVESLALVHPLGGAHAGGKKKWASNTPPSQLVPDATTTEACSRLTSEF